MFRTSLSVRSLLSASRVSSRNIPACTARAVPGSSASKDVTFQSCRSLSNWNKGSAPPSKSGPPPSAPKGQQQSQSKKVTPPPVVEESDEDYSDEEVEEMELTEALAKEITAEAAEESIDPEFEDIKKQIMQNFTVSDTVGKGVVTLHNIPGKIPALKGERLEITFDCQDESEQDMDDMNFEQLQQMQGEGEEEEPVLSYGINFSATITKDNGDKLVFDCVASEQLQVDAVQYVSAKDAKKAGDSAADVDGALYGGPVFNHLDETLQNSFLDYLEDRLVDDDLSFFVLSYARHKEQKEYVNWLNKVLEFADKKK